MIVLENYLFLCWLSCLYSITTSIHNANCFITDHYVIIMSHCYDCARKLPIFVLAFMFV